MRHLQSRFFAISIDSFKPSKYSLCFVASTKLIIFVQNAEISSPAAFFAFIIEEISLSHHAQNSKAFIPTFFTDSILLIKSFLLYIESIHTENFILPAPLLLINYIFVISIFKNSLNNIRWILFYLFICLLSILQGKFVSY